MSLKSGTYRNYGKAFVLDEDTLRRIEGLLSKHAADYPEPLELVFHIEREDDRFYETHILADVLADPNSTTKKINLLAIELRLKPIGTETPSGNREAPVVALVFDMQTELGQVRRQVMLRIRSPHRTWALLVADDIEPQIQRTFRARRTPRFLLLLFLIPAGFGFYRLSQLFKNQATVSSTDFVLAIITVSIFAVFLASYMSVARIISGVPRWFRFCFGPCSAFLWGAEIDVYQEREGIRKNILWVVIVGFIVSLAASLSALWF